MENLTVKNNYIYRNGKPFFILADTAWLLFDKLDDGEIELYFKNRANLGFNTIFAVAAYTEKRLNEPEYMQNGGKNIHDKAYWEFISRNIDLAEKYGLYVALLPTWGTFVKHGLLNDGNVLEYAEFLGKFFRGKSNLIWVLGGDIRGEDYFGLYDKFGNALKKYNPERLITYHPFGRTASYMWFNDCKWLDFNCFQSGHRRYDQTRMSAWDDKAVNDDVFGEDNWRYVKKNFSFDIKKPCMDAEPSYEGIVQGLHDFSQPYWEARDVRRYAYWSVFEGACGFTYGNNSIIQFHCDGERISYGVRENWRQALHSPGGAEMQYLKELMQSIDYTNGRARPEYVLNQGEKYRRTSVFAGDKFVLAYNFCGDEMKLSLKDYCGKTFEAFWLNPENNSRSYIGDFEGGTDYTFTPTPRKEISNDWILALLVK